MKRNNLRRRERGAVTVFLTLILVPCMIFTCVFGDVSRVALSKSQASGASDLALYSLMANYDEELKEWYGLVASCQSIEEFYDVSAEYFVGMMNANGIDGTASSTFLAYLDGARNGDFANFLQLDGLDSVTVKPVDNGALGGNPALIENGIVEFMKYRGPAVIVENLINRFQNMEKSGKLSGLTEAEENEPIVEAKKEYAEAEGEMMLDILHTYLAIEQYMDYRSSHNVPSLSKYQGEYKDLLKNITDDLPMLTQYITRYYAATDGIKNISAGNGYGSFPLFDLPDTNSLNNEADAIRYFQNTYDYTKGSHVYDMEGIGAEENEDGDYILTDEDFNKLIEKVDTHIKSVKDAAGKIVDACKGITVPADRTDFNDAIYCMRIQNAVPSSALNTLNNDGKALLQTYAKLILAQWCDVPEGGSSVARGKAIQETMDKILKVYNDYLSYTQSPSTDFERLVSQYKSIADRTVQNVTNREYGFNSYVDGQVRVVTVGEFVRVLRGKTDPIRSDLSAQIASINTILNGGKVEYPAGSGKLYEVVSLDTLKREIEAYCNARDNWGTAASDANTSYAKEERDEYNNISAKDDGLPAAIYKDGAESVEILRARLTNIRDDMQTFKDALEGITYAGQSVVQTPLGASDAKTADNIINAARSAGVFQTDPSNVSLSLAENDRTANGYHPSLVQTVDYTPPARISGDRGNEPDLEQDKPELYRFMQDAIKKDDLEKAADATKKQKEENENNQAAADQKAEASKGIEQDCLYGKGTKDPKEVSGEHSFGAGTVVSGLVGAVEKILNGNFAEFRDEIYVCEYIMEMFSYSSYNNEGCYDLAKEKGSSYTKDLNDAYKDEDLREEWKEEDITKRTENKSLTNHMINAENNRSNLAEVEYILYGKATNDENLKAAYTSIFVVREALNLISGFVNFYSDGVLTSIAATVMAATMGIIPEPVTKVVLIGLMATLESANDLSRLKKGTPVVIYKQKNDWVFAITSDNISDLFSKDANGKTDENGVFYSDYMLLFLMISANDKELYSDMLLRVGDLIEGNMAQHEGEDYDLEQAQCYFRMTGSLSVKPLLLKLPLVTNYSGADASRLFETTDWCSYTLDIVRGYS